MDTELFTKLMEAISQVVTTYGTAVWNMAIAQVYADAVKCLIISLLAIIVAVLCYRHFHFIGKIVAADRLVDDMDYSERRSTPEWALIQGEYAQFVIDSDNRGFVYLGLVLGIVVGVLIALACLPSAISALIFPDWYAVKLLLSLVGK